MAYFNSSIWRISKLCQYFIYNVNNDHYVVWLDFNLHGVGGGGADEEPVGEEDVYREGHHR